MDLLIKETPFGPLEGPVTYLEFGRLKLRFLVGFQHHLRLLKEFGKSKSRKEEENYL